MKLKRNCVQARLREMLITTLVPIRIGMSAGQGEPSATPPEQCSKPSCENKQQDKNNDTDKAEQEWREREAFCFGEGGASNDPRVATCPLLAIRVRASARLEPNVCMDTNLPCTHHTGKTYFTSNIELSMK